MPYLLDTGWAIDALGGKRNTARTIADLLPDGIAINWITVGEIYEGAFGFPEPQTPLAGFRIFLQ
jgi:predicted nucleic acid-binding protein